jgi:hypothetical protein
MPNGKGIVRVHNVPFPLHLGVPGHINSEQSSPVNPPLHTQTEALSLLLHIP